MREEYAQAEAKTSQGPLDRNVPSRTEERERSVSMSLDSQVRSDEFYARAYQAPAEFRSETVSNLQTAISYVTSTVFGFLVVPSVAVTYALLAGQELELISQIIEYPTASAAAPFAGALLFGGINFLTRDDKRSEQ